MPSPMAVAMAITPIRIMGSHIQFAIVWIGDWPAPERLTVTGPNFVFVDWIAIAMSDLLGYELLPRAVSAGSDSFRLSTRTHSLRTTPKRMTAMPTLIRATEAVATGKSHAL